MASKYDSAWQEYSAVIEEGEGQEFFDVDQADAAPEAAAPTAPAVEPSKYDQVYDEYLSGESKESELGAAWDVGVERMKGIGGAGLEMLAKGLQEGAAKRKEQVAEQLKDIPEEDRIPDWPWPAETPHRPLEGMEAFSKTIQKNVQKELNKLPKAPGFVRSGKLMENLKDPEKRGTYLKWLIGSNVQSTIAIVSASLIAGMAGGPTAAATVGGSGAYLLESGSSYEELLKMGVPEEEARGTAGVVGAVNAVLEMIPLGRLATKIPGVNRLIGIEVKKELVKRPLYRRVITETLKQGSLEGATEAIQEVVQNAGKKVYDENQELLHGTEEAAFIGALLGGMFGMSGAILPQGEVAPAGPTGSIFREDQGLVGPPAPVIEADEKVSEAAAKAGVSPQDQQNIQAEISGDELNVDLKFTEPDENLKAAPGTIDARRNTLKKEATLQAGAFEEELSLPVYPVEELPADTPIPAQVEELPITERIIGTEAVPPDAPPKIPRYDVKGLVASPEIVAKPVEEAPADLGSDATFEDFKTAEAEKQTGPEAAATAPEIPDQVSDIDVAATQARPDEASEPQIEAGTYKKGHVKMGGLDVSIENEAGSKRQPEWPTLTGHYGYVRGTEGKDGDQVDVFIKPGTDQATVGDTQVFVVDQTNIDEDFTFDEHKVMVGYGSVEEARQGYLSNYSKGWEGLGAITESSFSDFKEWLNTGNTKRPFAKQQQKVWSGQPTVPATTKAEETTEVQQLKRAKLTYEQWKESYSNTFKALQKYTPNQAGFGVHTSAMADLEDAYPGFAKRHDKELEKEQQTTVGPAETPAEAVDMAKVVASTGPMKAYALAKGLKWPMGPKSKAFKELKAEYTAAREKYERDTMEVKPPAGVTPEDIPRERPAAEPAEIVPREPSPAPEPLTVQEVMAATKHSMPKGYVIAVEKIDGKNTLTVKGPGLEEKGLGYNKAGIEEAIRLANVYAKEAAPTTATAEQKTTKLDLIKMPPETVEIEEGGTAKIEESAAVAIERVDSKLRALYQLRECLRS